MTVAAALRVARERTVDDVIVGVVPDAGDRYLSRLYDDRWLAEHVPGVIEDEASGSGERR